MPLPARKYLRLAPWLLALWLAACSGGELTHIDEARRRIQRGELELAEGALAGVSGPDVDGLRNLIERIREHREELDLAVAGIFDQAMDHEPNWGREKLAALLVVERDPRSRERLEQAMSDLATFQAERRSHLAVARKPTAPDDPMVARASVESPQGESNSLARASLNEARASQSERQWKAALAQAATAELEPGIAAEARLARQTILGEARIDAERVLERVAKLEQAEGARRAGEVLLAELDRFPSGSEFEDLRSRSRMLLERASERKPSKRPPSPPAAPVRPPVAVAGLDAELARAPSADECAALAQHRQGQGDLDGARRAWLEAARRRESQVWAAACHLRVRELDLRIALRAELCDYARVDAETARLLRVEPSDPQAADFKTIPLEDLALAIERARVSAPARLGWIVESVVRGDQAQRERALERLGSAVERGEIEPERASALVARARGEVSDVGWAFREGRWIEASLARREAATAEQAARAGAEARLIGEFRRANDFERDAVLARLRAGGDAASMAIALQKRWEDEWKRLGRMPVVRQLAGLAEERRALDAAREKALALIFDEERYFYPYTPPECPADKAAKYAAVQREVDELVLAVRVVWDGAKRVKLNAGLRELLEDAAWTAARAEDAEVELSVPEKELAFLLALPEGGDVGLSDFAWDASERVSIDESRRIEARNARLWEALEDAKPADHVPNGDERRQVEITNAYRRMLGRRSLAWNPKLEAAAQGHSDHMANTGEFSHFESKDPARRTPFDRMRLAGYALGVSENISMGHGDPRSAHEGWTHSSGHHRNLLMRDHREMASAIASTYWTQNFGVDSSFLADLE